MFYILTALSNQVEIVKLRGYFADEHHVKTSDGYYIHLVHLVHPISRDFNTRPPKQAVLFNHGFLTSSTSWLINSYGVRPLPYGDSYNRSHLTELEMKQNQFLNGPMLLANHGYDVWLMSVRGTDLSMRHISLKSDSAEFYNFSHDEYALRDLPAVVDFILTTSKAARVGYVGYSQANLAIFALLSRSPSWSRKIEPIVAIAPVSYFSDIKSLGYKALLTLHARFTGRRDGPFPSRAANMRRYVYEVCPRKHWGIFGRRIIGGQVCKAIEQFTTFDVPRSFWSHFPFSSSNKVVRHFYQLIRSGKFQAYDYGKDNMKVYNRSYPPIYPIGHIDSKSITLISSEGDHIATKSDINKFKRDLKVPLKRHLHINKKLDHLDLIYHPDVKSHVFGPMLATFEAFGQEIQNSSTICSSPDNCPHSGVFSSEGKRGNAGHLTLSTHKTFPGKSKTRKVGKSHRKPK